MSENVADYSNNFYLFLRPTSHGVGYATIKHLARHGAKVYMAARKYVNATYIALYLIFY